VFPFALEGAAYRGKRVGERKNLARDQKIGIFRPYRMPVHTLGSDRNLWQKIRAAQGYAFGGKPAQCDPADDSVFRCGPLVVEKLTELLGLRIARNGGGKPHPETELTRALDSLACSRPGSLSAMEIVPVWRGTVQTDLQNNAITRQHSQRFSAAAREQHSVGQYRGRSSGGATKQNLADIFQQKWLAPGDEDLFDAERWRFLCDPPHAGEP
jgi:hypothetical protein